MSNSKLSQKEQEELNKLETKALEELSQIISLAYQLQDIEYIDAMISAWKTKYKKILDNPSPDFKKKFEKFFDYYYSKLVRYILDQIKLKEEKVIENQRKALIELYRILKDNYDLETVKNKIKKWETKYPYDAFLKMYQKRIDSAKREKNLEQYAFNQEKAFKDLYYGVVNRSGTIKDLKEYLHKWEEKYSINDKFKIEHFIKHQSEVKRYISDEFLISIAKKEDYILDNNLPKTPNSSLSVQDSACKHLETIVKGNHSIDEVFKWVYKNNSIKFNDYYKQRIINATVLDYSPKYLKTLSVPDIDFGKNVLSIEQYNKINEIKRYAIISYFNLLLPQSEAVSNNFFTEHIRKIYYESERRKHSNIINTFKDEVTTFSYEISKKETESNLDSSKSKVSNDKVSSNNKNELDTIESFTNPKSEAKENNKQITTISDAEDNVLDIEELIPSEKQPYTIQSVSSSKVEEPITEEYTIPEIQSISISANSIESYETQTTKLIMSNTSDIEISPTVSLEEHEPVSYKSTLNTDDTEISKTYSSTEVQKQNIDYNTMIAFLPSFFETINSYSIQAHLIKSASKITNTTPSMDKINTNNKKDIRNQ